MTIAHITAFGKENPESIEYLRLTDMFLGKKYNSNMSRNDLIIDGFFLWELAACGVNIIKILKEADLDFGRISIDIGTAVGLNNYSRDYFKELTDKEDFSKTLSGEERVKYAAMLMLLGNCLFMPNKVIPQLEEALREYIRKNK